MEPEAIEYLFKIQDKLTLSVYQEKWNLSRGDNFQKPLEFHFLVYHFWSVPPLLHVYTCCLEEAQQGVDGSCHMALQCAVNILVSLM